MKIIRIAISDLKEPEALAAALLALRSYAFWALTGLAFGWAYCHSQHIVFGSTQTIIFSGLFATLLAAIAVADFKTMIVPDVLVYPLFLLALFASPDSGLSMAVGAIFLGGGFWLLHAITAKINGHAGLGFGDVKLVAALGLWVGADGIVALMLSASGIALLGLFIAKLIRGKNRNTMIPFAPYLAFGGWVAYGYSDIINQALINTRYYIMGL